MQLNRLKQLYIVLLERLIAYILSIFVQNTN